MLVKNQGERIYVLLASTTAACILLLIVLGALVRVTGADAVCGDTWHLCQGTLMPTFHDRLAWIDWGHRLSAALTGVMTLGTFAAARRYIANYREVVRASDLCLSLLIVQSLLGAGTLWISGFPTLTLLHLSFAVIMLSCLVAAITAVVYTPIKAARVGDTFPQAVYSTALMTFMVLLTGAMIVSDGASRDCRGFPLCGSTLDEAALLHLIHRGSVLVLGIILLALVWRHRTERPDDRAVRIGIFTLLALYLVQASIGGLFLQSGFVDYFSALHVLFAGLTWSAAIALSTIVIKQQESI